MTSDQEWAEVEREAFLADGDRLDAEAVMGTLLASPAGQRGDGEALLLAARAYEAMRSARRRSIDRLEEQAGI
jgi:hypothetical protein